MITRANHGSPAKMNVHYGAFSISRPMTNNDTNDYASSIAKQCTDQVIFCHEFREEVLSLPFVTYSPGLFGTAKLATDSGICEQCSLSSPHLRTLLCT
jgi:hypothetical protein